MEQKVKIEFDNEDFDEVRARVKLARGGKLEEWPKFVIDSVVVDLYEDEVTLMLKIDRRET